MDFNKSGRPLNMRATALSSKIAFRNGQLLTPFCERRPRHGCHDTTGTDKEIQMERLIQDEPPERPSDQRLEEEKE
jgi:hypothetical protein